MNLTYDSAILRFFLPWQLSRKFNHDVDNRQVSNMADNIELCLEAIKGISIGSGHQGIYFDIELVCDASFLPDYVDLIRKHAKELK